VFDEDRISALSADAFRQRRPPGYLPLRVVEACEQVCVRQPVVA
jgi:hypothetical protein